MKNIYWTRSVGSLMSSIWIYIISGILVMMSIFAENQIFLNQLQEYSETQYMIFHSTFIITPATVFGALAIMGYLLFIIPLIKFAKLQKEKKKRNNLNMIKLSYILFIVAMAVEIMPFSDKSLLFEKPFSTVAYVLLFLGYNGLRKSSALSKRAVRGSKILMLSSVVFFVGSATDFISKVGFMYDAFFILVGFVLTLIGWNLIRTGGPDFSQEEELEYKQNHTSDKVNKWLSFSVIVSTVIEVLFCILVYIMFPNFVGILLLFLTAALLSLFVFVSSVAHSKRLGLSFKNRLGYIILIILNVALVIALFCNSENLSLRKFIYSLATTGFLDYGYIASAVLNFFLLLSILFCVGFAVMLIQIVGYTLILSDKRVLSGLRLYIVHTRAFVYMLFGFLYLYYYWYYCPLSRAFADIIDDFSAIL